MQTSDLSISRLRPMKLKITLLLFLQTWKIFSQAQDPQPCTNHLPEKPITFRQFNNQSPSPPGHHYRPCKKRRRTAAIFIVKALSGGKSPRQQSTRRRCGLLRARTAKLLRGATRLGRAVRACQARAWKFCEKTGQGERQRERGSGASSARRRRGDRWYN